jgi:hypothetical protein
METQEQQSVNPCLADSPFLSVVKELREVERADQPRKFSVFAPEYPRSLQCNLPGLLLQPKPRPKTTPLIPKKASEYTKQVLLFNSGGIMIGSTKPNWTHVLNDTDIVINLANLLQKVRSYLGYLNASKRRIKTTQ